VGHNLGGNMSKSLVNYYKYLVNEQQAIADLNMAIELDPQYADAYNNRGVSYHYLHNEQRAIEDYN
jgi:tetratricopeptide (TPR) repeat protein